MINQLLRKKIFKWLGLITVFIFSLLVLVYAIRVQIVPEPDKNLLSDFAIYFNNLAMPLLTLGTILALLITLDHQREQLNEQRKQFEIQNNSQLFESYTQKFEILYERYLILINRPFPYQASTPENLKFKLSEAEQLTNGTEEHNYVCKKFQLMGKLREIEEYDDIHDDLELRIKFYMDDIREIAQTCFISLSSAYSFATIERFDNIYELWSRVETIAYDLFSWNIYGDEEVEKILKLFSIPNHLVPPELSDAYN